MSEVGGSGGYKRHADAGGCRWARGEVQLVPRVVTVYKHRMRSTLRATKAVGFNVPSELRLGYISKIGAESRPDIDSQFDEECDQGEKFRRIALPSFPRATGIRSTKRNIRPDYPRLSYVQIVADRARSSNRSRILSLSVLRSLLLTFNRV